VENIINMSTDKKTETKAVDSKPVDPKSVVSAAPPEDFTPLSSNALIYKPESCNSHAVKGFLLGRVEMPPVGGEREWAAYVLRATAPGIAEDREGNILAFKAGDEIRVPETHVLSSDARFTAIAGSPEWTAEVYLKPTTKISIGGGKTLWQYDARMGQPRQRKGDEKMYNLTKIVGGATAAGLPAHNGTAAALPPPPF
jgi:hypothetical protein